MFLKVLDKLMLLQREDLNPIEEALAYRELLETYNFTQSELSQKLGRERSTIANVLRLLQLSQKIQKEIIEKNISLGHAKVLLSLDSAEQNIWCSKAIQQKLSVRQLEKKIKFSRNNANKKPPLKTKEESLQIRMLEEDLQKRWGTKVQIQYLKGKGSITFNFSSADQFEEIMEKLHSDF